MISKQTAFRILDGIFAVATMLVLLVIAGFPTEWLLVLADLSLREVQWFALVIVFAAPWLIHAVARSNRVPRGRAQSTAQLKSSAMPGSPFSIARR